MPTGEMDATIHMRASDMPRLHEVSRRTNVRHGVFLRGGGLQGERTAMDEEAFQVSQP